MSSKRKPVSPSRVKWKSETSGYVAIRLIMWAGIRLSVRFPNLESSEVMAVDEEASRAPAGFLLRGPSPSGRGLG